MAVEEKIPTGPKGRRFIGNIIEFTEDPLGFLLKCSHEYGDLVVLSKKTYLVSHPELIEQVLHNKDGTYEKSDPSDRQKNQSAFPASVMSSSGSDWRNKRRMLQPAFQRALVDDGMARSAAITQSYLQHWRQNTPDADLRQEMQRICMSTGGAFLFNSSTEGEQTQAVVRMVDAIMGLTRSQIRFPAFIPTPNNVRLRRARADLDKALDRIIENYRSALSPSPCLLGMLLDHDGTGKSRWLRDELSTMIMSGLEPMADALTWVFYLLATHLTAQQKLQQEVDLVLSDQASLSTADLPKLPFTQAVVKEALRLYPPAWMTGRIAMRDTVLGGFHVPAGTTLTVSPWVSHRDARYFQDPGIYRPERWLDHSFSESLPKYAYFPFGGGARKCIGDHLSMMQIITTIAAITREFDLTLKPSAVVKPFPALVLRPLGVSVNMVSRH
ncbi:cytochrome P450 [Paracidovorax valerianellae]|uniref:Cytochrome P450 n=1 Tax=Paracidovorax valerianellae TaxID=187868 RepID=A0A1G6I2P5_9BURK|nr:cytochrome P450 [Paracidovorax valerianellae]MDA8448022.1 cytochrome P450 [Paracidovorax valerianellae]SDC00698.1 Cytochrome P450 [Paracidovorax valerianellae]